MCGFDEESVVQCRFKTSSYKFRPLFYLLVLYFKTRTKEVCTFLILKVVKVQYTSDATDLICTMLE